MTDKIAFVPRMEGLDALRGFALFGLFLVHMPELYELYWEHPVTDPVQLRWHDAVFTLFAGKAFALLAMCFGVSFFIIMDRAAQRGVDFTGRFVWRLLLLGVIGLLHSAWYRGDILEVLALMGLFLVPFFAVRSNRLLLAIAVFFLLQPWMIVQIASGLSGAAWANQPLGFWGVTSPEVYTRGGTLLETVKANIVSGHQFKWLFMFESGRLSQILGLSVIGLVLGRTGFFREPERYRNMRIVGLLASLLAVVALSWSGTHLATLVPATGTVTMPHRLWGSMLSGWNDLAIMSSLFFGFTALYYAVQGKGLNVLAPAGRMTLTLYLLQSLVFVPVFYSYGLNLHATMTQSEAVLLALFAFAVQLVLAHLWFRHFLFGPVEWLWRAGTYLTTRIPFVRRARPGPENWPRQFEPGPRG
jgi:uncharacterized protein